VGRKGGRHTLKREAPLAASPDTMSAPIDDYIISSDLNKTRPLVVQLHRSCSM
jgi:hypothetical protein